MTKLTTCY